VVVGIGALLVGHEPGTMGGRVPARDPDEGGGGDEHRSYRRSCGAVHPTDQEPP